MIESYSFGSIVVDGRKFISDLIIYPDGRIEASWWRKSLKNYFSKKVFS
ncbi:MAG: hypothetical protein LWW97_11200 [Deltaproteobacteria bacterium]|nr:hypothetical protein [Deltaproteobacteria bacterium]